MAVEVRRPARRSRSPGRPAAARPNPEPPEEFPPYPDQALPGEQPRPDNTLPGEQPYPDQGLPGPDSGGGTHPSHPIYLPPYIDNSLPGDQPRPDQGLPGNQPVIDNSLPEIEEIGLSDEQIEKLKGVPGGQPAPRRVAGDPIPGPGGKQIAVQVFAQGQEGDWSNTAVMPNDGLAVLSYPKDWTGESYVEVRALDGSLVDSGTITVK